MAFTPNTRVYLLDTPLDNNYKNTIHFDDIGDQHIYFWGCRRHEFVNVSYQRKDNIVRVDEHIDNLWNCNYVMYQNENFNNKWFYAFINKMEYVNDHRTDVYIETDVFQTWLFDVELRESFVVREHVASDTIGSHLVDEQLEIGEYKMETYEASGQLGDNWNILAVTDNSPLGNSEQIGNLYGNIVTGMTYFPFRNSPSGIDWLKATLQLYSAKPEAIAMLFSVPEIALPSIMNNDGMWTYGDPITTDEPSGMKSFTEAKRLNSLDGYEPKNNKMYTHPYKFLYATNNTGLSATYRYEDFTSTDMQFVVRAAVTPNPVVLLSPFDYRGNSDNEKTEYGLTLSGFPMGSWNTDAWAAWFAQNSASAGVALLGSTAALFGGIATANLIAAGGGAMGLASLMARIQQATIQPDQAKGQTNAGSIMYSTNKLDFYFAHMTIKAEYAKRIDDFFTMYGYKVNSLKVPETQSRRYWNYIQTIDVNISGAIPSEDMNRLKRAYNEGVTLWHTTDHFLDYSLDNTIL